jgi:branched-chain amino acid transport system substrate-binding protein
LAATPRVLPAAAGEPIRIGHQCDTTGALASSGYWRKKAVDAAAKWLNKRGGIAGRPIEVSTIDTETKVDVGISGLRQLLQERNVDFVIGSQHGGVAIASNPIMQKQKRLYLSMSRTDSITGSVGNPFVFRVIVNTHLSATAAAKPMVEVAGKKWAIIYADYVWGQSHRDMWTDQAKEAGGTVLQLIPIPVNASDTISYVSKLDGSVDGIFVALIGSDLPKAFISLVQLGFIKKTVVTADYVFGAFDIRSYGKRADGVWGMDTLPWELSDKDTPFLRNLREAVGIDSCGREVDTGRNAAMGEVWPAWESVSFLKRNVEGSGWKSNSDTEALIKYAEANPNYAESELFPQGSLYMRPQDHQAFCNSYLLQIADGKILVRNAMPLKGAVYPAIIDLTSK